MLFQNTSGLVRHSFIIAFFVVSAWAGVPVTANLRSLPLSFEKHGDTLLAHSLSYSAVLDGHRAAIQILSKHDPAIALQFPGSQSTNAAVTSELPGRVNYIFGYDPKKWLVGLPTFALVRYTGVYPGIDLICHGDQNQLEFDFDVKPGADPGAIRMKVEGAGHLTIDGAGNLHIGNDRSFQIPPPTVYQNVNGARRIIRGRYVARGDDVAFAVERYDRSKPLIIDPTIAYSGMLDSGNLPGAGAIQLDSAGNILIAGTTGAQDFPLVNAAQPNMGSLQDGFISKIDPSGTALLYSTYLGGSGEDNIYALAVDSSGAAWVTGYTLSRDFPLLKAAQSMYAGTAFVAKLSSAGTLQFSTYLGTDEAGFGIAVDGSGNGYVTGGGGQVTTTSGALSNPFGFFVVKYSPSGSLIYSASVGTNASGRAIGVDSGGNAYITGEVSGAGFAGAPTGGSQPANGGQTDAFVVKLSPDASKLLYFTYLGGTGEDYGYAIALDSSQNAYIAGETNSPGLATSNAAQPMLSAAYDGFVAKLNPTGSAFSYVTYLGGSRIDGLTGIALDSAANVYVTGFTDSIDLPVNAAVQPAMPGNGSSLLSISSSGGSWTPLDSTLQGAAFDISWNPNGSSAVAVTQAGIYRTTNGGLSWTQQLNAPGNSDLLARSPAAPSTIYAATNNVSIYQSTDDGVTWNARGGTGLPVTTLVADPLQANTVYALDAGYSSEPFRGLSISVNGGTSWGFINTPGGGIAVNVLAVTSDAALYVGIGFSGSGIFRSTDHGNSWVAVTAGLPSNVATSDITNRHYLTASGTTLYLADTSVYKITNATVPWSVTASIPGAGAQQIVAAPQNASVLYAFTSDNQVFESSDGGDTWSAEDAGVPLNATASNSVLRVDPGNSAHAFLIAPANQAAIAAKLNNTGTAWIWSTYLGGAASTTGSAITTDTSGDVFVTGATTGGQGFPVTSSVLPSGPNNNVFIAKIKDATDACSFAISPGDQTVSGNSQNLTYSVVAPSGCAWTVSSDQSWASIVSAVSGSGTGTILLQLAANFGGTQSAHLTIGGQTVTITQPATSCTFSLDQPLYVVPATGGSVTATLTAPADCPWHVTNSYPSNLSLTYGGSGTGSGTISIMVPANPSTFIRSFHLPVGSAKISIVQNSATVIWPQPTVGIANAASAGQAMPSVVSPGSYIAIYGSGLSAADNPNATTLPLPFWLNGTQAYLCGSPMPLLYAGPGQINALVPQGLAAGTCQLSVIVSNKVETLVAQPVTLTVQELQPGIYTVDESGSGAGIVTDAVSGTPISATNSAHASEYLVIYATGLGTVQGPNGEKAPDDGSPAPLTTVFSTTATVSATVGGVTIPALFAGLTPTFAGLYQVNIQLPPGITPGSAVPVTITAADSSTGATATSNIVTIAVQ